MCSGDQVIFGLFQKSNDLFATDGWKAREKIVNTLAGFEIIEQSLNGDSRACKHGRAAHDIKGL